MSEHEGQEKKEDSEEIHLLREIEENTRKTFFYIVLIGIVFPVVIGVGCLLYFIPVLLR